MWGPYQPPGHGYGKGNYFIVQGKGTAAQLKQSSLCCKCPVVIAGVHVMVF